MREIVTVGWFDRMDARNQAKAEESNVRNSNENWERRLRDEEPGSGRRFALFVFSGAVTGFLVGLAIGPVGGWRHPDLSDRLANAGALAGAGAIVGWRLWSAFGVGDD
jgi:hypothetical protein